MKINQIDKLFLRQLISYIRKNMQRKRMVECWKKNVRCIGRDASNDFYYLFNVNKLTRVVPRIYLKLQLQKHIFRSLIMWRLLIMENGIISWVNILKFTRH